MQCSRPQIHCHGRAAYNEVINRTEDQQLLTAIVRNRYGETISMLAVTNVTANIRFTTGIEAQVGIGDLRSYETNLIPFSGVIAFEDSPTISYAPIEGEEHFDRLIDLLIGLNDSGHLDWARDFRDEGPFSIIVRNREPKRREEIHELFNLLGISKKYDDTKPIVLSVYYAVEQKRLIAHQSATGPRRFFQRKEAAWGC